MILEPVAGRHLAALGAIAASPLVRAVATVPEPEHLCSWLRRFQSGIEHAFAIVEGGTSIGCVELGTGATLSFWIAPEHQGRGAATWAGARALEHGFGALGAPAISAHALAHNIASARVLAKLGFAHRSRTRNRDPRFSMSAWVDHFALDAAAWSARGTDGTQLRK